jgi:TolB-like protein
MFTDIVGYTAMMEKDSQLALKTAIKHEEIITQTVSKFNGQVNNFMGDGSLSLFDTASDAVNCAKEIQIKLNNKIQLRIGIHVGEITEENEKVYGDSINVASRIESSAHAGTVLFSSLIQDKIKNDKSIQYRPLGYFRFKNVSQPVLLFGLEGEGLIPIEKSRLRNRVSPYRNLKSRYSIIGILLILLLFMLFVKPGWLNKPSISIPSFEKELISVAVFPFKTSGSNEIEYLGEGIMDILYSKLISLEGMAALDPMICKSLYKRNNADEQNISNWIEIKDKDIDYTLTGSVIQTGSTLRLIGNLVNGEGIVMTPIVVESNTSSDIAEDIDSFSVNIISAILKDNNHDFTSDGIKPIGDFNVLKEYMLGEKERRLGNLMKAHGHFLTSVEMDSTFAMGWIRLLNNLGLYKPDFKLEHKSLEMANKFKHELPPQFQKYIQAYNLITEGKIKEGLDILHNSLKVYGDNLDVLYLLADVKYHTDVLFNESPNESVQIFKRLLEYSNINAEAELHLLLDAASKKDTNYLKIYIEKYSTYDEFQEFVGLLTYHYLEGNIVQEKKDSILQVFDSIGYVFIQPFVVYDKLDFLVECLNSYSEEQLLYSYSFEYNRGEILKMQGKYIEYYNEYPDRLTKGYFSPAYIMVEPNTLPLTKTMADSVLRFLDTYDKFYPTQNFHFTARSIYRVMVDDLNTVAEDLVELRRRKNDVDEKKMASYNYYRLGAVLARKKQEYSLAQSYLDTLYNNLFHWPNYDAYTYVFCGGLKYMEAEMLFEEGKIAEAKKIFEILDRVFFWNIMEYHGPIKFRLGRIYEEEGEIDKAYEFFKYFVSFYGDCDEFYQPNVKYAKKKIAEYKSSFG